ncbi:hypothetical protein YC2023_071277 [Brassica napus]
MVIGECIMGRVIRDLQANFIPFIILDFAYLLFDCMFFQIWESLKDFSEDSRVSEDSQKTLERLLRSLLRKSSNVFYARRLPMKSSGSLSKFWKTSGIILGKLSEDSRKTLGRLLGKSFIFYARRLSTKSSESLPNSSPQSGTKRLCEVESKLIYTLIDVNQKNGTHVHVLPKLLDFIKKTSFEVINGRLQKKLLRVDLKRSLLFRSFLQLQIYEEKFLKKPTLQKTTSEDIFGIFQKSSQCRKKSAGLLLQLTIFEFSREDFFRSLPSDDFSRSLLLRAKAKKLDAELENSSAIALKTRVIGKKKKIGFDKNKERHRRVREKERERVYTYQAIAEPRMTHKCYFTAP